MGWDGKPHVSKNFIFVTKLLFVNYIDGNDYNHYHNDYNKIAIECYPISCFV